MVRIIIGVMTTHTVKSMNKPALLAVTLLCFAGCGPSSMTVTSNGITYQLSSEKQIAPNPGVLNEVPAPGTNPAVAPKVNTGFTFFGEFHTIREYNGSLTINGRDFGSVKAGDTVRIDKSDKVFINGTARTPQ
jgi:hypothetical protein